jgi:hypothetical protein
MAYGDERQQPGLMLGSGTGDTSYEQEALETRHVTGLRQQSHELQDPQVTMFGYPVCSSEEIAAGGGRVRRLRWADRPGDRLLVWWPPQLPDPRCGPRVAAPHRRG